MNLAVGDRLQEAGSPWTWAKDFQRLRVSENFRQRRGPLRCWTMQGRIGASVAALIAIGSAASLCGCTAFAQYQYGQHTFETTPGRPTVAVARFINQRGEAFSFGTVGYYEIRSSGDVGAALQEELAAALQISGYNVRLLDTTFDTATAEKLFAKDRIDMVLGGEIQILSASTPDALISSALIEGEATVSFVTRFAPGIRQHRVRVSENRMVDMVGFKRAADNLGLMFGSHHHPGFDALFQETLARLAMGVVEDKEVRVALGRLKKAGVARNQ